jgi:hypothetical protein
VKPAPAKRGRGPLSHHGSHLRRRKIRIKARLSGARRAGAGRRGHGVRQGQRRRRQAESRPAGLGLDPDFSVVHPGWNDGKGGWGCCALPFCLRAGGAAASAQTVQAERAAELACRARFMPGWRAQRRREGLMPAGTGRRRRPGAKPESPTAQPARKSQSLRHGDGKSARPGRLPERSAAAGRRRKVSPRDTALGKRRGPRGEEKGIAMQARSH